MSAYVIVFMKSIKDPAELAEYRRIGRPSLQQTKVDVRVLNGRFEVLEGEPIESVVVLEFPSYEAAKAWYESPLYQDAVQHRFAGATCHTILVQGV